MAFAARGMPCEDIALDPSTLLAYPGLHALTQREMQLLKFAGVPLGPELHTRCMELSQTLGRNKCNLGSMDTITPGSRKYLTS